MHHVPGHREQGMVGEIIIGPSQGGGLSGVAADPTGVSHDFTLDFVESDDFRTLAFNALPGEDGNNPEIRVNSGDEVTITSDNLGNSFHAFGVVTNPEDFNSIIWDSEIAAATNPLETWRKWKYYIYCWCTRNILLHMYSSWTCIARNAR